MPCLGGAEISASLTIHLTFFLKDKLYNKATGCKNSLFKSFSDQLYSKLIVVEFQSKVDAIWTFCIKVKVSEFIFHVRGPGHGLR